MNLKILPYQLYSESAKLLADALSVRRLRGPSRIRPEWKILNWGNSTPHSNWGLPHPSNILNTPSSVANAKNKLKAFQCFKDAGVSSPDFTTSKEVAKQWLQEGYSVVCRASLTGLGGKDITIIDELGVDIPSAKMYTKYMKKKHEYRIHVFKGKVIDYQLKRKKTGSIPSFDKRVKSHLNGYVFCRTNVNDPPPVVLNEAIKAVQALGLDFGGVDVGYNKHYDQAYVYEVNTAPGIEGTTVEKYTSAIKEWWHG